MSVSLEKLHQIITNSSLSLQDQNDLLVFLPILPEQALIDLSDFFIKKPKLLRDFNENFKARLKILIDGKDSWDRLIDQEEETLNRDEQDEDGEEERSEED